MSQCINEASGDIPHRPNHMYMHFSPYVCSSTTGPTTQQKKKKKKALSPFLCIGMLTSTRRLCVARRCSSKVHACNGLFGFTTAIYISEKRKLRQRDFKMRPCTRLAAQQTIAASASAFATYRVIKPCSCAGANPSKRKAGGPGKDASHSAVLPFLFVRFPTQRFVDTFPGND